MPPHRIEIDLRKQHARQSQKEIGVEVRYHHYRIYQNRRPVRYQTVKRKAISFISHLISFKDNRHHPRLDICEEDAQHESRQNEENQRFLDR